MAGACEGRVALVTGASQGGTGTALAIRLAAEGARVAITARSSDGLEKTRARIEALGGTVRVVPCDLSDPQGGRDQLVAKTEEALGPIDILVNNAATGGYKPFAQWQQAELERMMQVNVWAPWLLMSQVISGMRERGRGWIVNLTSFSGELPKPPFPDNAPSKQGSAYGGSKAYLNRLTLSVASETDGQGIAVNALAPQAAIATPALVRLGWFDRAFFEPLEVMTEAGLALCIADPKQLHGRIAYSLHLLLELGRPVKDLEGKALVPDWQPADLPRHLERQLAAHERSGTFGAYDFNRPSSLVPPVGGRKGTAS